MTRLRRWGCPATGRLERRQQRGAILAAVLACMLASLLALACPPAAALDPRIDPDHALPMLSDTPRRPADEDERSLHAGTMAARLAACTGCHGALGGGSADGYFPRIAGKPAEYLYNQLTGFRDGLRPYRAMEVLLAHQSDAYLREMAQWFSAQAPAYLAPRSTTAPSQTLMTARELVLRGDASRGLPACVACHGAALTGVLPASPGLIGLPHDYIAAQFGAWRTGTRRALAPDCMADIAAKLRPDEVAAISAWLSSQRMAGAPPPEPAPEGKLPIACGSQPGPHAKTGGQQ